MSNETKDRKRAVLRRRMAVTSSRTAVVCHGQGCVAANGAAQAASTSSPGPPASHEVARDPRLAQPQSSAYLPTNDTVAVY
jgi:hypothetical protein